MIDIKSFLDKSRSELKPYLDGICQYVENIEKKEHPPDYGLLSKPLETYVRNIMAVSILSHLHRAAFKETSRRLVVLPECLKDYGDWACCKGETDGAAECTQCNSECQVFETVERFADKNTAIVLEPDDLKKYLAEHKDRQGTYGVVGVACALTLLSGFVHTIDLQLPTQGVFLNYASCGHHWASPGYNTSYSFRRLGKVLGVGGQSEPNRTDKTGETYSLVRGPLTPDDFYHRLDGLCEVFQEKYLSSIKEQSGDELFEISRVVLNILVPDLITRDAV